MRPIKQFQFLLYLSQSHGIARRYFVTNGFDGALTMLGLCMGFRIGGEVNLNIAISACLGAAIALGVSGLTSAYISESAERKKALAELEKSMVADLGESVQGVALEWLEVAAQKVENHQVDAGFYNLMHMKMNVLGDPVLEQPEFVALRNRLTGD